MKKSSRLARLSFAFAALLSFGPVGCDDGGKGLSGDDFGIDPASQSLGKSSGPVALSVHGGTDPLEWAVTDSSLGSLSVSTGRSVYYKRTAAMGVNTVTVTDAQGWQARAVMRQVEDTGLNVNLSISPTSADLKANGDKIVFSGTGGKGKYHWSVGDAARGRIEITNWRQALYTRLLPGNNTVVLNDDDGHVAVASITQSATVLTPLTVTASPSTLNNSGDKAVVAATGGFPPYSWTVADIGLGDVLTHTGNSVVYVRDITAGQNAVTVWDTVGAHASVVIDQP
jgi:hypothetical protein